MSTAAESNITALSMVIQASLVELRVCAEDMARDAKCSLPRLIDEASVLSGALQRLDRALEDAPVSWGNGVSPRKGFNSNSKHEFVADPELTEKWLLALDRARRIGVGFKCAVCGGVT